jgi:hypothetical protein
METVSTQGLRHVKRFCHSGYRIQNQYTHKDIHKYKATHSHSLTYTLSTHPPTHSLTNFNAISVDEAGRFGAHGGLQKTDLET